MATPLRGRIGLKDAVFAVLTETSDAIGSTPIYGTVTPLAKLVALDFDPSASISAAYADDGVSSIAEIVGDMKINLELIDCDPANIAFLLGHTYSAGQLVSNVGDSSPYIALGGKLSREGGAFDYFWFPKVKIGKPKLAAKTKASSVQFQTYVMEGRVARMNLNGNYRLSVRTDDTNVGATLLTNWFNQPIYASTVDLGAFTFTSAAGVVSTRTFTLTFAKAGGGSTIVANASAYNVSIAITSTGAVLAQQTVTPGAPGVSPTVVIVVVPAITAVSHTISVSPTLVDGNGISCAAQMRTATPA